MLPRSMICLVFLFSGCALRPSGERAERQRAEEAGRPYGGKRQPPALPERPAPDDYVRVALAANADLETRYWEWRAALERVPQDSSLPNVAVTLSYLYDYPFSLENLKPWNRTTIGVLNDPMTNIPFPTKLLAAGRRALEDARAAGLRFEAARFQLQGRVRAAVYDWALLAESIRLEEEDVALIRMMVGEATERLRSGSLPVQGLLEAQNRLDFAVNALERRRSRVPPARERLNALLGRETGTPLPLPFELPAARPLPLSDLELLGLASERSPELAALQRDVAGREEALGLARQMFLPDLGLSWSAVGSISRTVGGMLVLPTRLEAIRAGIDQAQAELARARAARAQYERDLRASFVLNLAVLRDAERAIRLFQKGVLPRTEQMARLARASYAVARGSLSEALESARGPIEVRLTLAELRMERERALAALETWAAVDVEAMGPAAARAVGRPAGASGMR